MSLSHTIDAILYTFIGITGTLAGILRVKASKKAESEGKKKDRVAPWLVVFGIFFTCRAIYEWIQAFNP